jgi:uncharacterized coiled-coil protein SlyX
MTSPFWFSVGAGVLLGIIASGIGLIIAERLHKMTFGIDKSAVPLDGRITVLENNAARQVKYIDSLDEQIGSCLKMINDLKNAVMPVTKMPTAANTGGGLSVLDEATHIQRLVKQANDKPLESPDETAYGIELDQDAKKQRLGGFIDIEAKIKSVGSQIRQKVAEVEAEYSCNKEGCMAPCKACADGKKKYRTVGKTFAEALTYGGS